MEGAGGTASLRKTAPHWSLAGDKQLLELLQNLHERIVTKCQEANSSLEEMVNTLDTASISLQNVNNRLMALSNSQFIESRVYEDEVDVATRDPPVKEPPKPVEAMSELSKVRDSLRVLEAYHEPVHILDSDSESASDKEEDRVVFKPKDLYSERPLPYIIGSQQWRSKWHAGLVVEQSDTESDTSKAHAPSDQYSDSEPDVDDGPTDKPHASQRTISTNSSIGSELTIPTVGKPADIAAELARRLGGNVPHVPEPEAESPPVAAAPTKIYRPQQPTTATIFSDEPPPLDPYQSDHSDQPDQYQSDSEDDVFAELHRQSHRQTGRTAGIADHLFGNVSNVYGRKGGFDGDADRVRTSNPSVKQPSPLFEEPQDSELFADKPKSREQPMPVPRENMQPDISVKKPAGGISLFGNNHGTESIGAAILKRNQRKASISDDEDQEPQEANKINDDTEINKTNSGQNLKDNIQKDLINDLFSKPTKTKQTNKKVENSPALKKDKPVNKKIDLFTDDLFDDIDDIFTNVKPPPKETKQNIKKSLFDDDNDDLFANVAATSNKTSSKPESKSKSIFDSDDDLFNEDIIENNAPILSHATKANKVPQDISNDGLFSEGIDNAKKVILKANLRTKDEQNSAADAAVETLSTDLPNEPEDSITNINSSESISEELKQTQDKISIKNNQIKSIFDSDSDDDIFSDLKSTKNNSITKKIEYSNIQNIDNTARSHDKLDKDSVTKNKFDTLPHSISKENETNYEKDNLRGNNSLIKEKEKALDNEDTSIPYNEDSDNNTNVSVDKFEDNNKKTDESLTESLDKSSEIENNTIMYVADKFLSSTNSNESIQNKEVFLSKTNVLKTQFHSPSLFDEDDDLDDIFNKSLDSNKSKESHNRQNSNHSQSPEFTIGVDNISDSKCKEEPYRANDEIINESDIYNASSKSSNSVEGSSEERNIQIDKTEKEAPGNDKPYPTKGVSKELRYGNNTDNISNSLEESEVMYSNDDNTDNSFIIPNTTLEEKKENKTDYDNISKNNLQEEPIFSDMKEIILGEPDIFSDIFSDVPPEFERPKEPKKSKNVNALFDDDSDDETLFFKKNEIVSDEKPDVSFSSQDDRLFHIFHDEPPAIDVDFTQKSKKSSETPVETPEKISLRTDIHNQTNVKTLFKEGTQKYKESSSSLDSESEKMTEETRKPVGKLKPMNFNINVSGLLPGASPKKTKTYEQVDGQVISSKSSEEVVKEESGMVKSVSFEGDPESGVLDNKLSKERAKIQVKRRPSTRRARKEAVRKSGIDFGDDSTDTSTSTDVAKKENYTEKSDHLQISSNTITGEEHAYTLTQGDDTLVDKAAITDLGKENSNAVEHNEITDSCDILKENEVRSDVEKDIFNNVETNVAGHIKNNNSLRSDNVKQEVIENSNLATAFNKRPNVTSKVVYILNDEDIFTDTKPVTNLSHNIQKVSKDMDNNDEDIFTDLKSVTNISDKIHTESENIQNDLKNKVLSIVDDDDELFKSGASKNTSMPTLGNVYKDVKLKNNEIDDFDSDEDIFKASGSKSEKNTVHNSKGSEHKQEIDTIESKIDKLFVKTQSTKGKSSLFDDLSDDESELFGSKKNVKNPNVADTSAGASKIFRKEIKLPKTGGKRSLFGDESDDDDLFGVRTTKIEPSQSTSRPKEVINKPAEPVFEDPLSILTQEDDI